MFLFQMAIPKNRTSYLCAVFEIPKFNETHHMIKVGILHLNYLINRSVGPWVGTHLSRPVDLSVGRSMGARR